MPTSPAVRDPQALAAALHLARQLYGSGRPREALLVCANMLGDGRSLLPAHAGLLNLMGACALQTGQRGEAERHFRQAMACDPDHGEAPANLGVLLLQAGRDQEAEAALARAVELRPANLNALSNRITALTRLQRPADAEAACRALLALRRDDAGAWNMLGLALCTQGRDSEAEQALREAIRLNPAHAEAHNQLGVLLVVRDLPAAEDAYRRAIRLAPGYDEARNNLGNCLRLQGQLPEAEAEYRALLARSPQHAAAWNNLGSLLADQGRDADAEAALRRAVELDPRAASGWNNLGRLMHKLQRLPEAVAAFTRVVALKPGDGREQSHLLMLRREIADWEGLAAAEAAVNLADPAIEPFELLAMPHVSAAGLRAASQRYARHRLGAVLDRPPLSGRRPQPRQTLRIGYLSADFHSHATVHLLAGVLEQHDAAIATHFLYSYGPASVSAERQRLLACGGTFRELRELSDEAAAQRILDDDIDILVDLKGFTIGERLGISALRPAPVIVNWLGYPGTLGEPRLADWLIGDPVVSPPEHAAHFSEALALMPHSYQPNDNRRAIGPRPTRAGAGLPEQGFVFCCFNQLYKLRPETFALWCRLLREVPGSVLWLWRPKHEAGVANLLAAAAGHGIGPERLVFAPSLPQAEHLARLALADLALDTFPVCSHTTASDALWAGLPLVTRKGETFVSRVAASLLTAANLPELVTDSDEALFGLALGLARDPARLAALRTRLEQGRATCPLFDTARFTRDLEALYLRIWAEACAGRLP